MIVNLVVEGRLWKLAARWAKPKHVPSAGARRVQDSDVGFRDQSSLSLWLTWTSKVPKIMAQYLKTESIAMAVSIFFVFLRGPGINLTVRYLLLGISTNGSCLPPVFIAGSPSASGSFVALGYHSACNCWLCQLYRPLLAQGTGERLTRLCFSVICSKLRQTTKKGYIGVSRYP